LALVFLTYYIHYWLREIFQVQYGLDGSSAMFIHQAVGVGQPPVFLRLPHKFGMAVGSENNPDFDTQSFPQPPTYLCFARMELSGGTTVAGYGVIVDVDPAGICSSYP
jgi:hypothetical protein